MRETFCCLVIRGTFCLTAVLFFVLLGEGLFILYKNRERSNLDPSWSQPPPRFFRPNFGSDEVAWPDLGTSINHRGPVFRTIFFGLVNKSNFELLT